MPGSLLPPCLLSCRLSDASKLLQRHHGDWCEQFLGQRPCEDSCSQQGSWAAGRWPPAGGLVAWLRLCGHTPDHNAGHGLQQLLTGLFRVPARSEPTKPSPWLYRPRHGLSGGPCGVASRAGVAARFRHLATPHQCTNSSRRGLSDALLGAAIRSRRFGSELPGSHTHAGTQARRHAGTQTATPTQLYM